MTAPALAPVSFKKGRAHAPRLSEPYDPGRHHPRYWSDDELAVLREYYPKGGAEACAVRLPGRSPSAIYGKAQALGLCYRSQARPRRRIAVDDGFDDRLRARWAELEGRGAIQKLADELGVPRWWLSKRANKLGLAIPHRKEPPWTAAEIALMDKVPLHSPDVAARIFRQHGYHRSATAIMVKATRLGLSRRQRDSYSATQVARMLGVDSKTVTGWCIAGDLKATRRASKRLPQQGGAPWSITREDLRRFIIEQLERIDIRRVDKFAFVDLLVAGETSP